MSFLQENRTPFLFFGACVVGTGVLFALIFWAPPKTQPSALPITALPQKPPAHIVVAADAQIVEAPSAIPSYVLSPMVGVDNVRAFWNLPQDPSRILQDGALLFWQTEGASVTISTTTGILHYTNNAASSADVPITSLDGAIATGETYLKGIPFLLGAEFWHVGTRPIKISGPEGVEVADWQDADAAMLRYGRRINGLPLLTAERPDGALYTVFLDKNGEIRSLDAALFNMVSLPVETPIIPVRDVIGAAIRGEISFVALSDEIALLDASSLAGKTVTIHTIELGYLLSGEQGSAHVVYMLKGTVDYSGKGVRATALYPASTQ
jgi:hypothetical protein